MTRRFDVAERRARLGRRHHLSPTRGRRPGIVDVAGDMIGYHATDPSTVYLSARARVPGLTVGDVERALYEERSLVRHLAMRRTMFTFPTPLLATAQAACTRKIAIDERRRLVGFLEASGIADPAGPWLTQVEQRALAALGDRGEATAVELSADVPDLARRMTVGSGKYRAETGVGTRLLLVLAAEGRVMRARPRGTWTSSQYRWAPTASWLGSELEEVDAETARADLARRWLRTFGPAPVKDLQWWTGWTLGQARAAIATVDAVEVELDEGPGVALADDLERVRPAAPWVALLPSLDPTTMGWQQRDWYLGDHKAALFDTNGNAGPTVWCDGRIVGGWAQRPDAEVVVRLLDDVGAEASVAIDAEAARLTEWFAGTRATPRFPTPLQRELSG